MEHLKVYWLWSISPVVVDVSARPFLAHPCRGELQDRPRLAPNLKKLLEGMQRERTCIVLLSPHSGSGRRLIAGEAETRRLTGRDASISVICMKNEWS